MKYDLQHVESHDIELCTTGANIFAEFYSLWNVSKVCNIEYKAFLDHRRICNECKEVVSEPTD